MATPKETSPQETKLDPTTSLPEENKPKVNTEAAKKFLSQVQIDPYAHTARGEQDQLNYPGINPFEFTKPVDIDEYIEGGSGKEMTFLDPSEIYLNKGANYYGNLYQSRMTNAIRRRQIELDENQAWYESAANTTIKFFGGTINKIVGGVLGGLYGLARGAFFGDVSKIYSGNEIFELSEQIDEDLNEALPVYASPDYHEKNVWGQLVSDPFKMIDEIGQAMSFTAAAIISTVLTEGAALGFIGQLGRIGKVGKWASNVNKIKTGIEGTSRAGKTLATIAQAGKKSRDVARFMQKAGVATLKTGKTAGRVAYSTIYEASIEARETQKQIEEKLIQEYTSQNGQAPTGEELELIKMRAEEGSEMNFFGNMAVISASELFTFPRLFMKNFRNANKTVGAFERATGKSLRDRLGRSRTFMKDGRVTARVLERSKKRDFLEKAGRFISRPIVEGAEEFSQGISNLAAIDYTVRKYDNNADTEATDYITALMQATTEAAGSKEAWKEFFLGAVMGMTGVPTPFKIDKQTGKTKAGFSMMGGAWESVREYNSYKSKTKDFIDGLNLMPTSKLFQDNFESIKKHLSIQEDLAEAMSNGDIKSYKDLEHDMLFNFVRNRQKAGAHESIIEELEAIKKDEELLKSMEKEGTPDEIRKEIDKAINRVKEINKSWETVDKALTRNGKTRGGELEEALVYIASSVKNRDERIDAIKERLTEIVGEADEVAITEALNNVRNTPRSEKNVKETREAFRTYIDSKDKGTEESKKAADEALKQLAIRTKTKKAQVAKIFEEAYNKKVRARDKSLSMEQVMDQLEFRIFKDKDGNPLLALGDKGKAEETFNEALATLEELIIENKGEGELAILADEIKSLLTDYTSLLKDNKAFAEAYNLLFTEEGAKNYNNFMALANAVSQVEKDEEQEQKAKEAKDNAKNSEEANDAASKKEQVTGNPESTKTPTNKETSDKAEDTLGNNPDPGFEPEDMEPTGEIGDDLMAGAKKVMEAKEGLKKLISDIHSEASILFPEVQDLMREYVEDGNVPDTPEEIGDIIDGLTSLTEVQKLDKAIRALLESKIITNDPEFKNSPETSLQTPEQTQGGKLDTVNSPVKDKNSKDSSDKAIWLNPGPISFKGGRPVRNENGQIEFKNLEGHTEKSFIENNEGVTQITQEAIDSGEVTDVYIEFDTNDQSSEYNNEKQFRARIFANYKGNKVYLGVLPVATENNSGIPITRLRKQLWEKAKDSEDGIVTIDNIELSEVSHGHVNMDTSELRSPLEVLDGQPLVLVFNIALSGGEIRTEGLGNLDTIMDASEALDYIEAANTHMKGKEPGYVYMLVRSGSGEIVPVRLFTEKLLNTDPKTVKSIEVSLSKIWKQLEKFKDEDKDLTPKEKNALIDEHLKKINNQTSRRFKYNPDRNEFLVKIEGEEQYVDFDTMVALLKGAINRVNAHTINKPSSVQREDGTFVGVNEILAQAGIIKTWTKKHPETGQLFLGSGFSIKIKEEKPKIEERDKPTDEAKVSDKDDTLDTANQTDKVDNTETEENTSEDSITPEENSGGVDEAGKDTDFGSIENFSDPDGESPFRVGKPLASTNSKDGIDWIEKTLGKRVAANVVSFEDEQALKDLVDEDTWNAVKEILAKGGNVLGMVSEAAIFLRNAADTSTAYHEAFHLVFRNFFNKAEREAILKEARTKYSKELKSGATDLDVEEVLADKFMGFMGKSESSKKSLGQKILDFFERLWRRIQLMAGFRKTGIDTIFRNMELGVYKGKLPHAQVSDPTVSSIPAFKIDSSIKFSTQTRELRARELMNHLVMSRLEAIRVEKGYESHVEVLKDINIRDVFIDSANYIRNKRLAYSKREKLDEKNAKALRARRLVYDEILKVLTLNDNIDELLDVNSNVPIRFYDNTFTHQILFGLKSHGINVDLSKVNELSEKYEEQSLQDEVENNEYDSKENWMDEAFSESSWEKIPQLLRHKLEGIPVYDDYPKVKDSSDESLDTIRKERQYKKSYWSMDFANSGTPIYEYVPGQEVYKFIVSKFSGIFDRQELIELLREEATSNPMALNIYDMLVAEPEVLDLLMVHTVKKYGHKYLRVVDSADGSFALQSNKLSPEGIISEELMGYFLSKKNKMLKQENGEYVIDPEIARELVEGTSTVDGIKRLKEKIEKSEGLPSAKITGMLRATSNRLTDYGFNITYDDLKKLYSDKVFLESKNRVPGHTRVASLLDTVIEIHKTFLSKGENPFLVSSTFETEVEETGEEIIRRSKGNPLKLLAIKLAEVKGEKMSITFYSGSGKEMSSHSNSTDIGYRLSKLKSASPQQLKKMGDDPILKGNDMISHAVMAKGGEFSLDVAISDTLDTDTNFGSSSVEFKGMKPVEKTKYDLLLFQSKSLVKDKNGNSVEGLVYMPFSIPGDAARLPYITSKRYTKETYLSKMSQIAEREYNRIAKVERIREKAGLEKDEYYRELPLSRRKEINSKVTEEERRLLATKNYDKNSVKFGFIPVLNDLFIDQETGKLKKFDKRAANEAIAEFMDNEVRLFTQSLIENGLAREDENKVLRLSGSIKNKNTNHGTDEDLVRAFVATQFISKVESITMFSKDIAFYKDMDDFFKRNKQSYSPRQYPEMDASYVSGKQRKGVRERVKRNGYNLLTVNEHYAKSRKEIYDAIKEMNGEEAAENFLKNSTSDAALILTPQAHRDFMIGMKKWNSKKDKSLEKDLRGDKFTEEDAGVFDVSKDFSLSYETNDGVGIPVQLKNAAFVLTRNIAYSRDRDGNIKYPTLKNMYDMMQRDEVDMLAYTSVVKVGERDAIHMGSTIHSENVPTSNEFIVVDNSTSTKGRNNVERFGQDVFDIDTATPQQVEQYLEGLVSTGYIYSFSKEDLEKFKEVNPEGYKAFKDLALELMSLDIESGNIKIGRDRKQIIRNIPYEEFTLIGETPAKYLETEVLMGSQIIQILFSDAVTEKQKERKRKFEALMEATYGEAYNSVKSQLFTVDSEGNLVPDYIAVADMLISQAIKNNRPKSFIDALKSMKKAGGQNVAAALKEGAHYPGSPDMSSKIYAELASFIRKEITKVKIKGAALVNASSVGYNSELELKLDQKNGVLEMDVILPWSMKGKIPTDKYGNIDMDKVDPEVLEVFGYRIPTEDKYSSVVMRIKGFSDIGSPNRIILPMEITTTAGLDFDVDKLYVWLPSLQETEGKWSTIKYLEDRESAESVYELKNRILNRPKTLRRLLSLQGIDDEFAEEYIAFAEDLIAKAAGVEQVVKEERKSLRSLYKKERRLKTLLDEQYALLKDPSNEDSVETQAEIQRLKSELDKNSIVKDSIKSFIDLTTKNREESLGKGQFFNIDLDNVEKKEREIATELSEILDNIIQDKEKFKTEDINIKEARDNKIIQLSRDNTQDPDNIAKSLKPTNFDDMKRLAYINTIAKDFMSKAEEINFTYTDKAGKEKTAKSIKDLYDNVPLDQLKEYRDNIIKEKTKYKSVASYDIDLQTLEKINEGRKAIGNSANSNMFGIKLQRILAETLGITIEGETYTEVKATKAGDIWVSNMKGSHVAAATDNSKEPTLQESGLTSDMLFLAQYMLDLEVKNPTLVAFLLANIQPMVAARKSDKKISDSVKASLRDVVKEMSDENVSPPKSKNVTLKMLEDYYFGVASLKTQYSVLSMLSDIAADHDQLFDAMMATSVDRNGLPTTAAGAIKADNLINKVRNDAGMARSERSSKRVTGLDELFDKSPEDDGPMSLTQSSTLYGFIRGKETLAQVEPAILKNMGEIVTFMGSIKGKPLTDKEINLFIDTVKSYVMLRHPFFTEENPVKFYDSFFDEFSRIQNKYANKESKSYSPEVDMLLRHFSQVGSKKVIEARTRDTDPLMIRDLNNIMERMMFSEVNPELKEFSRNLIKYMLLQVGYRFSPKTALNLVPESFTKEVLGATEVDGKKHRSYHETLHSFFQNLQSLASRKPTGRGRRKVEEGIAGIFSEDPQKTTNHFLMTLDFVMDTFYRNQKDKFNYLKRINISSLDNTTKAILRGPSGKPTMIVMNVGSMKGNPLYADRGVLPYFKAQDKVGQPGDIFKLDYEKSVTEKGKIKIAVYLPLSPLGIRDTFLEIPSGKDWSEDSVIEGNKIERATEDQIDAVVSKFERRAGIDESFSNMQRQVELIQETITKEKEKAREQAIEEKKKEKKKKKKKVLTKEEPTTSKKEPTVDSTKSWSNLKTQAVYTDEGVNTMRTSNKEAEHAHFGNPFSASGYQGTIKMDSVEEAIQAYKDWLMGEGHTDVNPEQREWVLDQINQGKLDNATLLYDAKLAGRGKGSHAEALAEVIEEIRKEKSISDTTDGVEPAEEGNLGMDIDPDDMTNQGMGFDPEDMVPTGQDVTPDSVEELTSTPDTKLEDETSAKELLNDMYAQLPNFRKEVEDWLSFEGNEESTLEKIVEDGKEDNKSTEEIISDIEKLICE